MTIKKASVNDIKDLLSMQIELWGEQKAESLKQKDMEMLFGEKNCFFLAYDEKKVIGFGEGSIRSEYVEGAKTSPIGYLEGIYVNKEYRHTGVGGQLMKEVEKWCGQRGCSEFASDTGIDNVKGIQFHESNGFREVAKIICYVKKI